MQKDLGTLDLCWHFQAQMSMPFYQLEGGTTPLTRGNDTVFVSRNLNKCGGNYWEVELCGWKMVKTSLSFLSVPSIESYQFRGA